MPDPEQNHNSNQPTEKRVCQYCQHENESNYEFCSNCGQSLSHKPCPRCSATLPIQAKFCVKCGLDFLLTNQIPVVNLHSPTYQQQSFYPAHIPHRSHPPEPRWWKLPAFFMVYAIFGLTLVTTLAGAILVFFLLNGASLSSVVASNYDIMAIDISELLFILFALKFFKGFHSFFKNQSELNQSPSNDTVFKIPNKLPMKGVIIRVILFILLFMSVILLIENIDTPIFQFLQNFFHLGPSNSPYALDNAHLQNYFFLIIFADCIFAPIMEEFIFRGLLQQALDKSGTSDFSHYLIQGTIFSLAHLAGDIGNGGSVDFIITHMIFTFVFAIFATFLRKKFNSLIPGILLHSLNNSIADFSVFLTPQFIPSNQLEIISILLNILPVVFIIIILAIFFLFDGWRLHIPITLLQDKNNDFTIRIILVALVTDVLQNVFTINPEGILVLFLLGTMVLSVILFIVWGKNVIDISWKQVIGDSKPQQNIKPSPK